MGAHDWKHLKGVHPGLSADVAGAKSDVYQCCRCGQICLSEIGEPPMEKIMGPLLEPCDLAIVKQVMTS
jgi:hypothetical protein